MTTVCAEVTERARKNLTVILQRLAAVGQARVAEGIGQHESTVSRWKGADAEQLAKMLALMGLKVVPIEMRCYPQHKIDAIFVLAKASMETMDSAEKLSFED
jgi:Bacteriophage CII protein